MHSRAKSPTKAEKRRMTAIAEIGCVCCRMDKMGFRPAEVHHLLDGGVRRGHAFTVGLCDFHHRGVVGNGIVFASPSLVSGGRDFEGGTKAFHAHYGTDDELLEYQDTLLKAAGFVLPTGPNLSSGECHGDDC